MGVRRAVDMVLDAANRTKDEPLFTYGPLIHNPQVLKMLEEKKINRLDSIPEKGKGIVLIRAHGVPPEDEEALERAGFKVINATCPRVVKVQTIIHKYAQQGYSTIIIGDEKHPEVVGLLGYAQNRGVTVTNMEQLAKLPIFENAVIVAQTTQNTAFYDEIKQWCETHAPHYKIFNTICGSTQKRQTEIRKMADEHDAVVVVGGKQSGNTRRLAQIASMAGKPSFHIEDTSGIDFQQLSNASSIAITAGASTPNWIINDTCSSIEQHYLNQGAASGYILKIRDLLLKTNIMPALGAGALTYACTALQGLERDWIHAVIATLYVLSMQIINNAFTVKSDKYNNPQRAQFYERYKVLFLIWAGISGAAGLYLSFRISTLSFFILLVMTLLGLSYNLKLIQIKLGNRKLIRIKDIPGSKTILITMAWGTVTCLLPALSGQSHAALATVVVFLFATGLVFTRTTFFDILAVQGDRISGKETIPILIGEKRSFKIMQVVLIATTALIFLASFSDLLVNHAFILAFTPFIMFLLIKYFTKNTHISGAFREFIVEFSFISTGLLAAFI